MLNILNPVYIAGIIHKSKVKKLNRIINHENFVDGWKDANLILQYNEFIKNEADISCKTWDYFAYMVLAMTMYHQELFGNKNANYYLKICAALGDYELEKFANNLLTIPRQKLPQFNPQRI